MSRNEYDEKKIAILIPALNEELAIGKTLKRIPTKEAQIVVIDNGSTDKTAEIARKYGATVILEKRRGYGHACLAGINYLKSKEKRPDTVIFLDADGSEDPTNIIRLLNRKYSQSNPNLVIGARLKNLEPKAMSAHAIVANKVFTTIIYLLYGRKLSDMGPLRVIDFDDLLRLEMSDTGYGWTAEMVVKALKLNFQIEEVQVSYHPQLSPSKISGSLLTSLKAAIWITIHIFRHFR